MKKILFLCLLCFSFLHFYSKNREKYQSEVCKFTIPTNVVADNITLTSVWISWDAIPGSTQFTVKIRQQGTSAWMLFPVFNLNTQGITTLSPCTVYEVQIMENLTGDTSESIFFKTQPVYCTSSSQSSGGWLLKVQVAPSQGSFPVMVSNSAASTYSDYKNDPLRKITLLSGSVNNFFSFVTASNSSPHIYVKAWIDFNGNGIFETQELIADVSSGGCCQTIPFNVPNTVISDIQCSVALRVINSVNPINDSCGQFTSGEVEDYAAYFSNTALRTDEYSKRNEIAIFPNPASDTLNVLGLPTDVYYEIYNAAGQKLEEGKTKNKTVNVSGLIKGVYFIQIKEKENSFKLKFIKN